MLESLVRLAYASLGPLPDDRCYCLKLPGPLGGRYAVENIATLKIEEAISASGHLAQQIKDLPDGAKIRVRIVG